MQRLNPTLLRLTGLALFVAFAAGGVLFLLQTVGTNVKPGQKHFDVRFQVPNSIALAAHADVRQGGVKIGQVSKIDADDHGPILTLELDHSHDAVHRDATVLIRAKSIAEENYVELDPGTPAKPRLAENALLGPDHALEATQHDQVFSILDKLKRRDVGRIARGAGDGLKGPGGEQLNSTVEGLDATVEEGQPLAALIANERDHFAGLIDSFGKVTYALGERRAALQTFTRQAKVAAVAVDDRDAKLRSTLQRLPAFLAQARQTAGRLGTFSQTATPVFADLASATEDLVPATTDLRPAAAAGRQAVAQLGRFSTAIRPVTQALTPFGKQGTAFVPPFSEFLRQANPFISYLEPYNQELGRFFSNTGAAVDITDPLSKLARITLPVSLDDVPDVLPPEVQGLVKQLSPSADSRGVDPYPSPGTAGTPGVNPRTFTRVDPDAPYVKK